MILCIAVANRYGLVIRLSHPLIKPFGQGFCCGRLREVMQELAMAIVRDGEGATKFVTVEVIGAINESDATKTAFEMRIRIG